MEAEDRRDFVSEIKASILFCFAFFSRKDSKFFCFFLDARLGEAEDRRDFVSEIKASRYFSFFLIIMWYFFISAAGGGGGPPAFLAFGAFLTFICIYSLFLLALHTTVRDSLRARERRASDKRHYL